MPGISWSAITTENCRRFSSSSANMGSLAPTVSYYARHKVCCTVVTLFPHVVHHQNGSRHR